MKKLLPLGLVIVTLASQAPAADRRLELGDIRPQGLSQPFAGGYSRLDAPIAAVLLAPDAAAQARRSALRTNDGRVQVEIVAEEASAEGLVAWLEGQGVTEIGRADGLLDAWVPISLLPALDDAPGVEWVRRPIYGVLPAPRVESDGTPKITAISEALPATNAPDWHADGFTGQGVKVGVIDIEMYGWESLLGSDLPPAERVHFQEFGGSASGPGAVHGTAVAEIVHDMAPDAELYLARIGGTTSNFVSAVNWMVGSGVRVIAMSITFFGVGPGDGTGYLQSRIDSFVQAADGVWAHSAGNYRDSHWQGQSVDGDGNGWVELADGLEVKPFDFSVSAGDDIRVSLQWSDWSAVSADYSLHLFKIDGTETTEVASADSLQTGLAGQSPTEFLDYTAAETGRYGVGIFRKNVIGIHDLEYFSLDVPVDDPVGEGSLTTPGDAPGAMATAAMAAGSAGIRSYSSAGPANGPGGLLSGGFIKPDIAGYDGVTTVSYSGASYGTSFACPHVAGAAALVMSAHPEWSGAQVRAFLEDAAIDKGHVGMDPDFGWGRLNLGPSPVSTCSYELSQTALEFPASSSNAIIDVTTGDDCFWAAESESDWMRVPVDSGTGPGRAIVLVEANPGGPRSGSLRIAGQSVPVVQQGSGCSYTVDPLSLQLSAAGGTGEVRVTTAAGCAWTAVSQADWIEVASGSSGNGSGAVVLGVDPNAGGSSRTGSLVIADRTVSVVQLASGSRYVVAGIAETAGAAGTRWRSDLALTNRSGAAVEAVLTYRHGGGAVSEAVTLGDGDTVELANIAGDLFGVPASSGLVDIQSSGPLVVAARTFNDAPTGTFGQFLPGIESDDAIFGNGRGVLSQLRSDDGFRTNIGFVNLGAAALDARVRLYDGSGAPVGSPLVETVPGGRWMQINRAFDQAGAGDCTGCYALVELSGGGGPLWAYASVVDNGSGDPTTVPLVALGGPMVGADLMVAGIADTAGAAGTRWSSNVAVLNLSGGDVEGTLEYRHGSGAEQAQFALADGELVEWESLASQLGAPDSAGSVAVAGDGPVIVTARTFNDAPAGTFGQFLPGLSAAAAIGEGEPGVLPLLKRTDDFRTNVGFTNYGLVACDVRVRLFGADGTQLGSDVVVEDVPAGGWKQRNRIFQAAGVAACPIGYAVVTVETPGCEVWAYGSVVDNGSGDPTTVPVDAD